MGFGDVASTIGHRADGKTVIDVTNVITPDMKGLAVGFTTSGAEEWQKRLPQAHVIKAFNTEFANTMDSGEAKGEPDGRELVRGRPAVL